LADSHTPKQQPLSGRPRDIDHQLLATNESLAGAMKTPVGDDAAPRWSITPVLVCGNHIAETLREMDVRCWSTPQLERGHKDMPLYKFTSPGMQKKHEQILSDPDFTSLKKEIEITEDLRAKLEEERTHRNGRKLEALNKEIARIDATLATLRKTQSRMDTRTARTNETKP
jgi:hypothetical protein